MASFTNQATLAYNGLVVSSNQVQGEILEPLTINKHTAITSYRGGDVVTYVVTLTNSSAADITNLTVEDDLGTYDWNGTDLTPLTHKVGSVVYLQNGQVQTQPAVTAGPPLSISGITVPAGGTAVLVYEAAINQFAPLDVGTTITNTAATTGLAANVSDTQLITVAQEPDLRITKALSPAAVPENGSVTYTFTIENYGNAAADLNTGVVLSDTFQPALTNMTVNFDGTNWTGDANKYFYGGANGQFNTKPGQITVPEATFARNATTGAWETVPGVKQLIIVGTI